MARTFLQHVLDSGGTYEVDSVPVMCDVDPITSDYMAPSEKYYLVTLFPGTQGYVYLIPAVNNKQPNEEAIGQSIQEYLRHPVEGGRDWISFIDLSHPQSKKNEQVRAVAGDELSIASIKLPVKNTPKFSLDDYL